MKRTCPRCSSSIWVVRPYMAFGMHRPILLFGHKPTLREIDAFAWPVMSEQMRRAFLKPGSRPKPRRKKK